MKLFTLLASAFGLAYAVEEAADVPEAADAWQSASSSDKKTWKNDVLHAASTAKQIKNKSCQVPKGKSLSKLGDPTQVAKHYYKLKNGNSRATYQFKFKDGTMVYAGNSNVGQKGGNWKIYCYRQGHNTVTRGPHEQHDLDSKTLSKLRYAFNRYDTNHSGKITTGGAYAALTSIFPTYSLPNYEATLQKESIKSAGKDKVVDLDEFECVAKKLWNIQKVYNEFRQYDKNHDLKMDRKELEGALIKFYFKDVGKKGLIQTATNRAKVKTMVDAIIKRHDKNHDSAVTWNEFEMDAFNEEHYNPGAKCQTSKTPLNGHEISVVQNLIKKFKGNTKTKELSHSMWYQITSMLTEQAIDAVNGPAKGPALGCWHKKPTQQNKTTRKRGGFGQNGGNHFGYTKKKLDFTPQPRNFGGRVLLERMLQQKPQRTNGGPQRTNGGPQRTNGGPQRTNGGVSSKTRMTVMQALQALHKQADRNNDGKISDHEILDIFQGVRDHLSTSDFGAFLDMVNKLHGPVNCGKAKDCGKCTAVSNAGLCGWFAVNQRTNSAFGGYYTKSKGNCKFVDRSMSSEQNTDSYKLTTCSQQCKKKTPSNPWQNRNNNNGGRNNGGRNNNGQTGPTRFRPSNNNGGKH